MCFSWNGKSILTWGELIAVFCLIVDYRFLKKSDLLNSILANTNFFFNWNVAKHSKVAELTTEERQLLNAKITWWSGLSVKTLSWENRIGEWLIFRPLLKIKDLNQNSGNKISFTFKYWLISDLPKLKKLVPINWCTPKLTFYHAEKASAGSIFSILTHQVIYLYLIVDPQTMLLVKLVKIILFVVSHW